MKKIDEPLQEFFKQFKEEDVISFFSNIRSLDKLIEEPYNQFTEARDIKNHVLIIGVIHPSALMMLKMEKEKLLKRVQTSFPELKIKDIQFISIKSFQRPKKEEKVEEYHEIETHHTFKGTKEDFYKLLDEIKQLGKGDE